MNFFIRKERALLIAAVVVAVCVSSVVAQGATGRGTFTDNRDGKTYKTVKIGNQTWMAENMNYKIGNSWCSENYEPRCQEYGRLYDWGTAKPACPSGWHLPTRDEWNALVKNAGGTDVAGKKLKDKSGWYEDEDEGTNGNGTNDYGFSALPGGYRDIGDIFDYTGHIGNWWTATDSGSGNAYNRGIDYGSGNVYEESHEKGNGFSVRCLRDD